MPGKTSALSTAVPARPPARASGKKPSEDSIADLPPGFDRSVFEDAGPAATAERAGKAAEPEAASPVSRVHRSARRRLATERVFAELASLAAISVDSYAIGEEVEGALCLLETDDGFEVFHSADGNRHELQFFRTEEAACFYLYGVLTADAVRNGLLAPAGTRQLPPAGALR